MADITVDNTGTTGFSPSPYPNGSNVTQGQTITFSAVGSSNITFFAQSGLFYAPGYSGPTNTGSTPFVAPPSTWTPLSLVVAANPVTATTYKLALSSVGCEGVKPSDDTTPSDGTINVSTKPTEWSEPVTDPSDRAPRRPAPVPAMQARGSD